MAAEPFDWLILNLDLRLRAPSYNSWFEWLIQRSTVKIRINHANQSTHDKHHKNVRWLAVSRPSNIEDTHSFIVSSRFSQTDCCCALEGVTNASVLARILSLCYNVGKWLLLLEQSTIGCHVLRQCDIFVSARSICSQQQQSCQPQTNDGYFPQTQDTWFLWSSSCWIRWS